MLLPVLRAVLVAVFALASLTASAQTFGEFLSNQQLPVTFMGVDFSTTRYYGPSMTVDAGEMKAQFGKINDLLVKESSKYDIGKALSRPGKVEYATSIAEALNAKIDTGTIIVRGQPKPRNAFTPQTLAEQVKRYASAGHSGVGLVFVVEEINKNLEQEIFWAVFVDLSTREVLYSRRMMASGAGFGFRNHWARPLYVGIQTIDNNYGRWQKEFAAKK